jgi:hypothetical protein
MTIIDLKESAKNEECCSKGTDSKHLNSFPGLIANYASVEDITQSQILLWMKLPRTMKMQIF